jgi:integrase
MSVRLHKWSTTKGEAREAWLVQYSTAELDSRGKRRRHTKFFERKKDAVAFEATVRVNIRKGTHVPDSRSPDVAAAGKQWLESCEADGLERTTIDSYRNHIEYHVVPYFGPMKLSALSVALIRDWQDKLRNGEIPHPVPTENPKRSDDMVARATRTLGTFLADSQERGLVAQNMVRSLRRKKRGKRSEKGNLRIGVDIPTPSEIDAILGAAEGRWRPLLLVAVRCGLRASELRGLTWNDIDLRKAELHVRQRADMYNTIGLPKSGAGERTIPIPPATVAALREWKLQCPRGELGLVFPTPERKRNDGSIVPGGEIESHGNIVHAGLEPTLIKAGVVDANGKPKYSGLHTLRHYFASWCINRRADGGLELPAKMVQVRMGHSNIAITLDLYSHLFPRGDDSAELAAAEGKNG